MCLLTKPRYYFCSTTFRWNSQVSSLDSAVVLSGIVLLYYFSTSCINNQTKSYMTKKKRKKGSRILLQLCRIALQSESLNEAECFQSSREKIHPSKNPRMMHPQIVYLFLNRAGRGSPGRRRFGGLAQQELCGSGGHGGAMNLRWLCFGLVRTGRRGHRG